VKDMAKFLNTWRMNPMVPMSPGPAEQAQATEMLFAMLDNAVQSGQLLEFGFFADGTSGYAISAGETADIFRSTVGFYPWIVSEVREMIPYETGKEIMRGVLKAQIKAMKQ
jgi:hypothetical protein